MKIFLDDERDPVGDDWIVCRTADDLANQIIGECIRLVNSSKDVQIEEMSFDHDLGPDEPSGDELAKRIILVDGDLRAQEETTGIFPDNVVIHIHSMNPVGAKNIADRFMNYFRFIGISDTAKVYVHGILYRENI